MMFLIIWNTILQKKMWLIIIQDVPHDLPLFLQMNFAYDFWRFYLRSHFLLRYFLNLNLLLFILIFYQSPRITLAFRKVILFTKRLWSDLFAAEIAYLYFHMVLIHYYVLILKYFSDLNWRVFASALRIYIWFLLIDLAVETFLKRIIIVYFFIFWKVYLFYTLIQFDSIILTIVIMTMIL